MVERVSRSKFFVQGSDYLLSASEFQSLTFPDSSAACSSESVGGGGGRIHSKLE